MSVLDVSVFGVFQYKYIVQVYNSYSPNLWFHLQMFIRFRSKLVNFEKDGHEQTFKRTFGSLIRFVR